MNNWEKFDKEKTYPRHPHAHKNGGFHMNFEDETRLQDLVVPVIKQIGSKMAKGDFNLATIAKPIVLTHPVSGMECTGFDHTYSAPYLNMAAKCKDPLERMQLIVTASVAAIHKTQSVLKTCAPIDCVMGETVQRMKSDGTRMYSEFIKTNPPTSLFQVHGPNDDWVIHGVDEVHAHIHPTFTTIIGKNPRAKKITFSDGKVYEWQLPQMIINGVLKGDRILNMMDPYTIKCTQDKLVARINFAYQYEGKATQLKNKLFFWSKSEKPLTDLVDIQINKLISADDDDEQAFTLSHGSGSWLSHLEIDGQLMWKIDDVAEEWQIANNLLPSDSAFREDRILMLQGQNDKAQVARNAIEEQARQDHHLQKKHNKQQK